MTQPFDPQAPQPVRFRRDTIRFAAIPTVTILAAPADALFQGAQLESFFPASAEDQETLLRLI
jgi:hypothetical protein